jgi:hypothetical protein
VANALHACCVVYDCVDELSAFPGAPRQLRQRESALMKRAGLVLTGGPSLYAARRELHANVHCLSNAVDVEHLAPRGLQTGNPQGVAAQTLQAAWQQPRAGHFDCMGSAHSHTPFCRA